MSNSISNRYYALLDMKRDKLLKCKQAYIEDLEKLMRYDFVNIDIDKKPYPQREKYLLRQSALIKDIEFAYADYVRAYYELETLRRSMSEYISYDYEKEII